MTMDISVSGSDILDNVDIELRVKRKKESDFVFTIENDDGSVNSIRIPVEHVKFMVKHIIDDL